MPAPASAARHAEHCVKLTRAKADEIRRLFYAEPAKGMKERYVLLADRFGVSPSAVGDVVARRTWSDDSAELAGPAVPSPANDSHHRRVRDEQIALIEAALGRPLRRVLGAVAVLLLLAVSAGAQTVTATPTDLAVAWDPPVDPATSLADYVEYYLVKQGAQPGGTIATLRVDSGREYRFVPADPAKVYYFRVAACKVVRSGGKDDPACSPDSNEANTSAFVVTEPPVDACAGAVVLSVGDWTRTADGGASAQVFWTLGRSTQPVTKLTVYLDGVAAPDDPSYRNPVTGNTDLRGLGASRFRVPRDPGVHLLSLVAESPSGCKGTADRLMPLVVR